MQNRLKKAALPLAAALSLTVMGPVALSALTPMTAGAVTVGTTDGCTPGYWKNHTESWEEFLPGQTLNTVFVGGPSDVTMLQALQGGGGGGVEGARKILLRAATASVLNAAHESLAYPIRRNSAPANSSYTFRGEELQLRPAVSAALASNDRAHMLELARVLDDLNNLGCPL